jgi:hypothetical protein
MPLAQTAAFGNDRHTTEDRFICDFSWREEIGRHAVARPGFDDSLRLRPRVGGWLVRLAPLIRPLVQAKWAGRVAARNTDRMSCPLGGTRPGALSFGVFDRHPGRTGRTVRPCTGTAVLSSLPPAPLWRRTWWA